jgi:hypothetical protein
LATKNADSAASCLILKALKTIELERGRWFKCQSGFDSEKMTWFCSGVVQIRQNQRVFARSFRQANELIVLDRFTWR